MKNTIALLLLSIFIAAPFAYADDAKSSDSSCGAESCKPKYKNHGYALELVPKFYFLKDSNTGLGFVANGYGVPSRTQFGGDIRLYGIKPNGWQVGFDMSGLDYSNDGPGASTAISSFSDMYGGIWIAKQIPLFPKFEMTVGSVFGFGIANMEVLGTISNGRVREFAMVVEPTVSFNYQICHSIKVGAMVSYLLPFLRSADIKGQNLGFTNVSAQGFSTGLQVAFGRFHPPSETEEKE